MQIYVPVDAFFGTVQNLPARVAFMHGRVPHCGCGSRRNSVDQHYCWPLVAEHFVALLRSSSSGEKEDSFESTLVERVELVAGALLVLRARHDSLATVYM